MSQTALKAASAAKNITDQIVYEPVQNTHERELFAFFRSLSKKSRASFNPHPFTATFAHKICLDHHSRLRLRLVALNRDGAIIGYAFLHRLPLASGHAYFGIAVSDAWQGRGIGSKLLRALIKYGKENGVHTIYLNVFTANKKAIAVYSKIGFRVFNQALLIGKLFTLNELIYNGELAKVLISLVAKSGFATASKRGPEIWMSMSI